MNRAIHPLDMYKNYLKTAWRNLTRNSVFSLINISGLALGLTCSLLIALWVRDEYQMDAFHENADRLFAVTSRQYSGSEIAGGYGTPGLLGDELKKVLPEVEYASNYGGFAWHTFSAGDKIMKLPGKFAGADFFKMFSYPLLLGTKESALESPVSIAISRTMAVKLFGSVEMAMDKAVKFENNRELKVTAVFEDLKDNVSDQFQYLINWHVFEEIRPWVKNWGNMGAVTFVTLRENANMDVVRKNLRYFLKGYVETYTDAERVELDLQLYKEKYLHSNFKNGYPGGGRIEYVRLFWLVAVFILLIACINFMNL